MLMIRLQRAGKKNKAQFRLVVTEKTKAVNRQPVEILGVYNPHNKTLVLRAGERLQYWMGQNVEYSATAHNLLVTHKFIDAAKTKAFSLPKKEVVVEAPAPAAEPTKTEEVTVEAPAETVTEEPVQTEEVAA